MMYRLLPIAGEAIDRNRPLSFTFEGARYQGFSGDTISSALAAAGVMILGRSFKYHRPRGIMSFANHDVNALFQVGAIPNVRGDVTALQDGMQVAPVNTFGSLARDSGRWMEAFARFLPVGFYYKAFHSQRLFPHWERLIRGFSGLGRIGLNAPRTRTRKRYAFFDVLVIGGGVSGMSAALTAAAAGASVLLVDEGTRLQSTAGSADAANETALLARLRAHPNIDVLSNAFAAGYYADHWIAVIESERMTKVRARAVVLATGAIEQPAVFRNNDLPGVLLMSAALRLLRRHAVGVGRRVVIVAQTAQDYAAALEFVRHGITVTHMVEGRAQSPDHELTRRLKERGVELMTGRAIVAAHAGSDGCIRRVTIARAGALADNPQTVECDALVISGHWAGATALLLQAGGTVRFDVGSQMYLPDNMPAGTYSAGAINGIFSASDGIVDGQHAGQAVAEYLGLSVDSTQIRAPIVKLKQTPSRIVAHPQGKDFIDFDEDLQVKDLEHAVQEGFDSIELMKRYTTVGMGPSQGKHSNVNAAQLLARIRALPADKIGLTTARPMYHPVPMKHLSGRGYSPERATPIASRHQQLGAVWMPAGNWRRPEYYARAGETRELSIAAEVAAVRTAVGIIDVGTLGKLEIHGADAGEFLDRVYCSRYSDLAIGMTRYALMLDEAGTIVDDGVIARTGAQSYYFTTTTGGSATVYRELLRLNAQWGLDCALVNVTGHRAAFNLAGPRSRELLAALVTIDLSEASFPYLGYRETTIAGIEVRLLRVGFVGELGYEIHVPYSQAAPIWDELLAVGIRPFGVEAQRVLRLEKAHFIVGQDTDGLTNPFEVQAKWALKMTKPFFIGQRSLRILEKRGARQLLVGFEIPQPIPALKECHLVIDAGEIAGRITSVAYSHILGKTIGLAMVKPALAAVGTKLVFRLSDGATIDASVCKTPFYDRDGKRQKGAGRQEASVDTSVQIAIPFETASRRIEEPRLVPDVASESGQHSRAAVAGFSHATFDDRTQRRRVGLKGPRAAAWLQERGISIPQLPNSWTAITASENDVVMRLGSAEFFFEQSVHAEEFRTLASGLSSAMAGVYPVLREDRAFVLSGPAAEAVLAEVCNVNFSGLLLHEQHAVMTMMIGVAVTVVPQGNVAHRRYLIWCDPSFGDYLASSLQAVVADMSTAGEGT